jgi:uncharacterized protein (TIGR02246 family)
MKRRFALPLLAISVAAPVAASTPADEAEIRAVQQQQATAWNAHDIDAYAALFTEDAHVVNVLGWHWKSRAELKAKLGPGFASIFARSRLAIGDVDVAFFAPDIAVAHVRWTMTGAASPTGAAADIPQQGIQTLVMTKRDGAWRIAEFQNTNAVPERPLPAAPR